MKLPKSIKSQLSKVKFAAGLNPRIKRDSRRRDMIPPGYEAVLTITADFELAWAPRYTKTVTDPLDHALRLARRERNNLPRLLELSDRYEVPVTWATVGHLFLDSCHCNGQGKHPEIPQVPAYQGPYWNFHGGDWFEYDPCGSLEKDPEWYAPDLIEKIMAAPAGHEVGCHTFSHIDCRDEACPPELFRDELKECIQLAEEKGLRLRSFVHPGHTIGNLDGLAEMGFSSFQSDPGNVLGLPIRHANGLWELERTMEFTWRPEWSPAYHVKRYKTIIDRAIRSGTVCNFWFHPSFPLEFVENVIPPLFEYIADRRDRICVSTVGHYVEYLNTGMWDGQ